MCTPDAWFSIKEVDIGLAADVGASFAAPCVCSRARCSPQGTLQRIQHVVGSSSLVRDLAFTARRMESAEALQSGFVSRIYANKELLVQKALDMAKEIASKSPVAIYGTKHQLNYVRLFRAPRRWG